MQAWTRVNEGPTVIKHQFKYDLMHSENSDVFLDCHFFPHDCISIGIYFNGIPIPSVTFVDTLLIGMYCLENFVNS